MLKPGRPREPEFLAAARRARPRLLPGGRLRRAGAAAPRSTSRGTAGSTCTSRCCPPGAARRRCSTRSWPATRSPAPPPSCSRRAWTPARSSASSPSRSGPRDTAGDLLDRLAVSGRRAARAPPSTGIEAGALVAAPQPADGVTLAPKIDRRGRPRSTGRARAPRRPADPRPARPRPAPGPRSAGSGSSSGPVTLARRRRRLGAGRAAGRPRRRVLVGTGTQRRCVLARCSRRARSRCPPPTGPAACAPSRRAAGSVTGPPASAGRAPRAGDPPCRRSTPPGAAAYDVLRGGRTSATPTPTCCCRSCCASAGSPAATPPSPPSWPTGRCAGQGTVRRGPGRAASTGRWASVDPRCSTLLRLGAYQLLDLRVPSHAAVGTTVDLARAMVGHGRGRVRQRRAAPGRAGSDLDALAATVAPARRRRTPTARLAVVHSPPALDRRRPVATRSARTAGELEALLAADNERARGAPWSPGPGRAAVEELVGGRADGAGPLVAVRRAAGRRRPGRRARRCARAGPACRTRAASWSRLRAGAGAAGRAATQRWLDLCAGPGGKAALLAARGRPAGCAGCSPPSGRRTGPSWCARRSPATRARTSRWSPPTAPGRRGAPGSFDRVLRRRARAPAWARCAAARGPLAAAPRATSPALVALQRGAAAQRAATRSGPAASSPTSTCSPHLAETVGRRRRERARRDASTSMPVDAVCCSERRRTSARGRHGPAVAAPARHRRDVPRAAAPPLVRLRGARR